MGLVPATSHLAVLAVTGEGESGGRASWLQPFVPEMCSPELTPGGSRFRNLFAGGREGAVAPSPPEMQLARHELDSSGTQTGPLFRRPRGREE